MNHGVDNRHQSWQVEPKAMELFADALGADQTLFSTNGRTGTSDPRRRRPIGLKGACDDGIHASC